MASDYEAKVAEWEVHRAKWRAETDVLIELERDFVAEFQRDEALRLEWVAKYDAALEVQDQSGIAAYMTAAEEIRNRQALCSAALAQVRGDYETITKALPPRPRRSWGQLLGFVK